MYFCSSWHCRGPADAATTPSSACTTAAAAAATAATTTAATTAAAATTTTTTTTTTDDVAIHDNDIGHAFFFSQMVVLSPEPPTQRISTLLEHPRYRGRVKYVQASVCVFFFVSSGVFSLYPPVDGEE